MSTQKLKDHVGLSQTQPQGTEVMISKNDLVNDDNLLIVPRATPQTEIGVRISKDSISMEAPNIAPESACEKSRTLGRFRGPGEG